MTHSRSWLACLVLLAATSAYGAEEARPVALAGASYGRYEVQSVIRNALTISSDLEYIFEKKGEAIAGADFQKYSLVIIAHSVSAPLTAADNDAIQKYLEAGGHLLLINSAPASLGKDLGLANLKWFGPRRMAGGNRNLPCAVLQPDHPFLKGIFDEKKSPEWLNANTFTVAEGGMQNLVGTADGKCLVGYRPVGKGWVAYLGHELFRLKGGKDRDAGSYITLVRNIVAAAAPLTEEEALRNALKAFSPDRPVLLWNREWQRGEEYGPRFDPPLPSKSELISSLSADMAVDEYETLELNVTPVVDVGDASWEIIAGQFPSANARFFVQDKPDPIPWPKDPAIAREAPYWLMPTEFIAPKGRKEFSAPAGQTRILWLKLSSFGVAPGTYDLTLKLSFSKGQILSVPVTVKVYPVRLPQKRIITLAMSGQVYGDVNSPAPALRFANDMEEHGVEWSLINVVRTEKVSVAGRNEKLSIAWLNSQQAEFEAGRFPTLDFTMLDEWMDQAISHGLTAFTMSDPTSRLSTDLGKSKLPADLQGKVKVWFLGEFSRYLREKGVRLMVVSSGDEMNERDIREKWLPWAKELAAGGMGCTSSFSGFHLLNPDENEMLYPYVRLWTLNRGLAPTFLEKLRSGLIKVRSDAIIGTYGAGEGRGSEHRKPLGASRFLGWESWMYGIRNCSTNPYFKSWLYYCRYDTKDLGMAGERWVSYLNKDDLSVPVADCPFLEGIRDGMEEGNLCEILSWYLCRMDEAGGSAAQKSQAIRARLAKVLGSAPDCILRWKEEVARDYKLRVIKATNEDFRRAKREVLEMLADIRGEAVRAAKPSLDWNDTPLVKHGVVAAAIYSGQIEAGDLAARMEELSGAKMPVLSNAAALDGRQEVAIVIGDGRQNALAATLLKAAGLRDADEQYPGKGSYCIREFEVAQPVRTKVLLIAGPDEAGTRKGVKMFSMFLHGEGNWLIR